MPEHPNHTRTEPKRVYLTPEARGLVQEWADREGVTFSAAIETLARLGLRQDPRDAWGPALAAKVVGAVRADLARYRALLAATALDAGIGMRMAAAAAKTLRPADYPRMKRLARLEAIQTLRTRNALAELGFPPDPLSADAAQEPTAAPETAVPGGPPTPGAAGQASEPGAAA
jgi:hypothetical protein